MPPLVEIGLTDLPKVPGDDTPASPQPTYEQNGKHRLFFQNFEMTSESRITCPLQLENLSSVRIHIMQLKIIFPLLLKQLNFHFLGNTMKAVTTGQGKITQNR